MSGQTIGGDRFAFEPLAVLPAKASALSNRLAQRGIQDYIAACKKRNITAANRSIAVDNILRRTDHNGPANDLTAITIGDALAANRSDIAGFNCPDIIDSTSNVGDYICASEQGSIAQRFLIGRCKINNRNEHFSACNFAGYPPNNAAGERCQLILGQCNTELQAQSLLFSKRGIHEALRLVQRVAILGQLRLIGRSANLFSYKLCFEEAVTQADEISIAVNPKGIEEEIAIKQLAYRGKTWVGRKQEFSTRRIVKTEQCVLTIKTKAVLIGRQAKTVKE